MKVLELKDVKKTFQKNKKTFTAVDGVSFSIEKGECVGLVGESGCGKSTIARMATHLEQTTSGEVFMNERNVTKAKGKELRNLYQNLQMVFQNPSDSFNPRIKLGSSIGEVLINFGKPRSEIKRTVAQLLEQVGLKSEFASRYPHEVSGGQCQRAAIARAIAIQPDLLICDEATSALDVSVQAQIVDLILKLRHEMNMSYLFISHDLSMIQHISDRVGVMYLGSIVELAPKQPIYSVPKHPYTQALISAIPVADPEADTETGRIRLEGEVPSPLNPPSGCKFRTRCRYATERCANESPQLREVEPDHFVACHLYDN